MRNSIIAGIVIAIISKLLGGSYLVSLILGLSFPSLYYLSLKKEKIISIIIGATIVGIDLFLTILLIVPTKSYNINVDDYYKKKENYAKIFLKDTKKRLKKIDFIIENNGNIRESINLADYKKGTKILLKQGDKLVFACKIKKYCKLYRSFVAVYLWDDSIIRITPGTTISLNKIDKNLGKLSDSKTNISIQKGNLWFKVIRLIKDGESMNIETGKGQALIIRGTAGFVSKEKEKTYAIDYSHYIEVKNDNKSVLLKQGEGAELENNEITIQPIDKILKNIGIDENLLKEFDNLDKKYIDQSLKELHNYLNNFNQNGLLSKLEQLKIKTFSIGDKKYQKYLENLTNYEYLIGKGKKFTDSLINNPNLAFLASNLQKTEVKIKYLYNEVKNNIQNSDIYKTYIINQGIEGKIKNVAEKINNNFENLIKENDLEKLLTGNNSVTNEKDLIPNIDF